MTSRFFARAVIDGNGHSAYEAAKGGMSRRQGQGIGEKWISVAANHHTKRSFQPGEQSLPAVFLSLQKVKLRERVKAECDFLYQEKQPLSRGRSSLHRHR